MRNRPEKRRFLRAVRFWPLFYRGSSVICQAMFSSLVKCSSVPSGISSTMGRFPGGLASRTKVPVICSALLIIAGIR